jgi:hypothetical protein
MEDRDQAKEDAKRRALEIAALLSSANSSCLLPSFYQKLLEPRVKSILVCERLGILFET